MKFLPSLTAMKRVLYTFAMLWINWCCQGRVEPEEDYTDQVTGLYTAHYYQSGSTSLLLPSNGVSITILSQKQTNKSVSLRLSLVTNGITTTSELGVLQLQPTTTADSYNLLRNGQTVGSINPTALFVEGNTTSGEYTQIRAQH